MIEQMNEVTTDNYPNQLLRIHLGPADLTEPLPNVGATILRLISETVQFHDRGFERRGRHLSTLRRSRPFAVWITTALTRRNRIDDGTGNANA